MTMVYSSIFLLRTCVIANFNRYFIRQKVVVKLSFHLHLHTGPGWHRHGVSWCSGRGGGVPFIPDGAGGLFIVDAHDVSVFGKDVAVWVEGDLTGGKYLLVNEYK